SITDGLTKLANRRYFDDFLMAEWLRAKREGKGIGLIMADIDFFKAFNDHYGHLEGDRCLKQIAQALQYQAQRPRDLVARFGGEEFAVVLPSIQFEGMRVVAERLLETVRQLKISHAASTVANHVTISMGLAWSEPGNNDKLETLIEAADEALYAAKGEGRDRMSETIDLASVRSLIPSG
ncbi:MAG: GGDEF domain-containing protein, partial [Oleibacter sp.]|nr:GGDEF domain-containing protein [Thalassolituus sp.]